MATRQFALNKEPHVADLGDVKLYFLPEVTGAEFAQAYASMNDVRKKLADRKPVKASSTKHAKAEAGEDLDPETLGQVSESMRSFVRQFLTPESLPVFDDLRIPDRVFTQLIEWIPELYGGGSGNPDADGGTSSN